MSVDGRRGGMFWRRKGVDSSSPLHTVVDPAML